MDEEKVGKRVRAIARRDKKLNSDAHREKLCKRIAKLNGYDLKNHAPKNLKRPNSVDTYTVRKIGTHTLEEILPNGTVYSLDEIEEWAKKRPIQPTPSST